jgi:hypothetical protein
MNVAFSSGKAISGVLDARAVYPGSSLADLYENLSPFRLI